MLGQTNMLHDTHFLLNNSPCGETSDSSVNPIVLSARAAAPTFSLCLVFNRMKRVAGGTIRMTAERERFARVVTSQLVGGRFPQLRLRRN